MLIKHAFIPQKLLNKHCFWPSSHYFFFQKPESLTNAETHHIVEKMKIHFKLHLSTDDTVQL